MGKKEYLEQLGQRLKSLPAGEVKDALDYYDGYITDSGNEAAAIAQLGPTSEVASQILANYVTWRRKTDVPRGKGMGFKAMWGVLLVLLSPVALPLAASVVVLIVALFICILALGFAGAAGIIAGIVGLVTVPFALFQHFGYALTCAGTGLVGIGLGLILLEATRNLWSASASGIVKMINRISKKGGK
jgi:uncharacterized membrane protein